MRKALVNNSKKYKITISVLSKRRHEVYRYIKKRNKALSEDYWELVNNVTKLLNRAIKEISLIMSKDGYGTERYDKIKKFLHKDLKKLNDLMYAMLDPNKLFIKEV